MRYGVCAKTDTIKTVIDAGFDYVELNLSKIAAMGQAEFDKSKALILNEYGPIAECFNGFFPADMKIVGKSVDFDLIKDYTKRALYRASELGCKIAVLGSGKSRKVEEGEPFEKAREQFMQVLNICGEIGAKYGIVIVIEPLSRNETNLINTVTEAARLCKEINHPNVKCLADFFHMYINGESLDDLSEARGILFHTHIARANADRGVPTFKDIKELGAVATALKKQGYDGRITLEGNIPSERFGELITEYKKLLTVFD